MAAAEALAKSLEQLPEFLVDARVAGYWAVGGEMPLHAVYSSLRAREQEYFLPLLAEPDLLRFAAWQPGAALRHNRYGIPEPDVFLRMFVAFPVGPNAGQTTFRVALRAPFDLLGRL